jgi:hypothetical protein
MQRKNGVDTAEITVQGEQDIAHSATTRSGIIVAMQNVAKTLSEAAYPRISTADMAQLLPIEERVGAYINRPGL